MKAHTHWFSSKLLFTELKDLAFQNDCEVSTNTVGSEQTYIVESNTIAKLCSFMYAVGLEDGENKGYTRGFKAGYEQGQADADKEWENIVNNRGEEEHE